MNKSGTLSREQSQAVMPVEGKVVTSATTAPRAPYALSKGLLMHLRSGEEKPLALDRRDHGGLSRRKSAYFPIARTGSACTAASQRDARAGIRPD